MVRPLFQHHVRACDGIGQRVKFDFLTGRRAILSIEKTKPVKHSFPFQPDELLPAYRRSSQSAIKAATSMVSTTTSNTNTYQLIGWTIGR